MRGGKQMKYTRRAVQYSLFPFLVLACIVPISVAQQQSNIVFRDDFTGKSLNPKWRLISPDKDRWTFVDGEYLLIVSTDKATNFVQFTGDLPDDYEIIIKVDAPPQYDNQFVQLRLVKDSENNLRIGYYPDYKTITEYFGPRVYFVKTLKGKESTIFKKVKKLSQDEPLYVKLSKRGVEYTGAYSVDGSTWIEVGTHTVLNFRGKPDFGAYNVPTYHAKPPESGIRFDYFEITKLKK
jgi:hypothetical protein